MSEWQRRAKVASVQSPTIAHHMLRQCVQAALQHVMRTMLLGTLEPTLKASDANVLVAYFHVGA
jgi:hypothetical protein